MILLQKTAAGVTGAIAVGAGAVLLAASVELTNPDGSKKANPLAQGLQRLGVPSVDQIKGKVRRPVRGGWRGGCARVERGEGGARQWDRGV